MAAASLRRFLTAASAKPGSLTLGDEAETWAALGQMLAAGGDAEGAVDAYQEDVVLAREALEAAGEPVPVGAENPPAPAEEEEGGEGGEQAVPAAVLTRAFSTVVADSEYARALARLDRLERFVDQA